MVLKRTGNFMKMVQILKSGRWVQICICSVGHGQAAFETDLLPSERAQLTRIDRTESVCVFTVDSALSLSQWDRTELGQVGSRD